MIRKTLILCGLISSACNQPVAEESLDSASATNTGRADSERTALQHHVDFFDSDADGWIGLSETYNGLRRLGISRIRAGTMSVVINGALSRTIGTSLYHPMSVNIENIHLGKHDSDSDTFDVDGHFDVQAFNAIFERYDANYDHALSESELDDFYAGQYESKTGSIASKGEFDLLMELAGEERGDELVLTRDTLVSLYDGTLFYDIAGEPLPPSLHNTGAAAE